MAEYQNDVSGIREERTNGERNANNNLLTFD